MTKEDLQKIIEQFNQEDLERQGVFGVFQYGGGSDESFIRANKEGLELFALELLKSARDADEIIESNEKSVIPFDYEEEWIDENSDTFIQYVQPISDRQMAKQVSEHHPTIVDKLMPYGCGLLLLILDILICIGLGSIYHWFF